MIGRLDTSIVTGLAIGAILSILEIQGWRYLVIAILAAVIISLNKPSQKTP